MKKPQHCGLLNNNVTNYIPTTCNYNRLTDSMTGCVNSVTVAFSPSSSRPCHSAQSRDPRHPTINSHGFPVTVTVTVTVTVSTKRQAVYPFP